MGSNERLGPVLSGIIVCTCFWNECTETELLNCVPSGWNCSHIFWVGTLMCGFVNQNYLQVKGVHKATETNRTSEKNVVFVSWPSRQLNIRSLKDRCLVNAFWQLCYKCRLPVFIVGSLVNVNRWRLKGLQMTGMPKSASSLLATCGCVSVIRASHHILGPCCSLSLQLAFGKRWHSWNAAQTSVLSHVLSQWHLNYNNYTDATIDKIYA